MCEGNSEDKLFLAGKVQKGRDKHVGCRTVGGGRKGVLGRGNCVNKGTVVAKLGARVQKGQQFGLVAMELLEGRSRGHERGQELEPDHGRPGRGD